MEREEPSTSARLPTRVRGARIAYAALAWAFVAAVAIQVFYAGLGIFVDSANWARHTSFVHTFELLPLILFGLAFAGRLRGGPRWLPLVLFVLLGMQYATAEAPGSMFAALHPVNALLIFWGAVSLARRGWQALSRPELVTS